MHQLVISYDRETEIAFLLIILWLVLTILAFVNLLRAYATHKDLKRILQELQLSAENFYEAIKSKKN